MVALNENFAPENPAPGSKNRVGNFFGRAGDCAGVDRPATRNRIRDKRADVTIIASGRPYWPNRDPIGERGGLNLFVAARNDAMNSWDYLGLNGNSGCCKERTEFKPHLTSVDNVSVSFNGMSLPKLGMAPPLEIIDLNFSVSADIRGYASCKKWNKDCSIEKKQTPIITVSASGIPFSFTVGAGPKALKNINTIRKLLMKGSYLKHTDEVLAAYTASAGLDQACAALF